MTKERFSITVSLLFFTVVLALVMARITNAAEIEAVGACGLSII